MFLSEVTIAAMMAGGGDVVDATEKLQREADEINIWTRQWLFKHFIFQLMHNI